MNEDHVVDKLQWSAQVHKHGKFAGFGITVGHELESLLHYVDGSEDREQDDAFAIEIPDEVEVFASANNNSCTYEDQAGILIATYSIFMHFSHESS